MFRLLRVVACAETIAIIRRRSSGDACLQFREPLQFSPIDSIFSHTRSRSSGYARRHSRRWFTKRRALSTLVGSRGQSGSGLRYWACWESIRIDLPPRCPQFHCGRLIYRKSTITRTIASCYNMQTRYFSARMVLRNVLDKIFTTRKLHLNGLRNEGE